MQNATPYLKMGAAHGKATVEPVISLLRVR